MNAYLQAAGIDNHYLNDCSKQQKIHFHVLGSMNLIISTIGAFAVGFALHYIKINILMCLFIGILFGLIILNLYRFMFSAIVGNHLFFNKENTVTKISINVGDLTRILFIGLIGMFIIECLGLWIFKSSLDYLFKILNAANSSLIKALQKKLLVSSFDIKRLKVDTLLNRFTLLHLAYNKKMWIIRAIGLIILEVPLILKSFLPNIRHGEYEQVKEKHETLNIRHFYSLTEQQYKKIFKEKVGYSTEIWCNYEDPPFNTIPKVVKYNHIINEKR